MTEEAKTTQNKKLLSPINMNNNIIKADVLDQTRLQPLAFPNKEPKLLSFKVITHVLNSVSLKRS